MQRGRLIKKSQQSELKSLQVQEYPWRDLSPETILLPDNARRSVILAKSHPKSELTSKVQPPSNFSESFTQPTTPLYPQDLTEDFLISQEELRWRKRHMMMNEEEVVALELQEHDNRNQDRKNVKNEESKKSHTTEQQMDVEDDEYPSQVRHASPDISDLSSLTTHKGKNLSDKSLEFSMGDVSDEQQEVEVALAYERGVAQGRKEGEQLGLERARAENSSRKIDPTQAEELAKKQELLAKEKYDEGFEAGIVQGHTSALKEADEKYSHSLKLFTQALAELQHLKSELLSTGREIFSEIVQICADKVLRKHVEWNDEALKSVFSAAMSQFSKQDDLKIEMHPDDIVRLESQIPEEQRTKIRLVGNSSLGRGDLKIEANNEVVSFDIEKTVKSVIVSLKNELFEEAGKDESKDKAG